MDKGRHGAQVAGKGIPALLLATLLVAGCILETRYEPPRILFLGNSITRHPVLESVG